MKELNKSYITKAEYFDAGNGQMFRETLLRLAVKYCENHATDVIYLIDYVRDSIGKDFKIEAIFRQYGVDWNCDAEHYRYKVTIQMAGDCLTLHGEVGNV